MTRSLSRLAVLAIDFSESSLGGTCIQEDMNQCIRKDTAGREPLRLTAYSSEQAGEVNGIQEKRST